MLSACIHEYMQPCPHFINDLTCLVTTKYVSSAKEFHYSDDFSVCVVAKCASIMWNAEMCSSNFLRPCVAFILVTSLVPIDHSQSKHTCRET